MLRLYKKQRHCKLETTPLRKQRVRELSYSLYEKDHNKGSIKYIVKGDTIIADYNFNSEGATSNRQVAWIKKGGKLIEGFGETEEANGRRYLKILIGSAIPSLLNFRHQNVNNPTL